jgi:hypothetical protein
MLCLLGSIKKIGLSHLFSERSVAKIGVSYFNEFEINNQFLVTNSQNKSKGQNNFLFKKLDFNYFNGQISNSWP